MKNITHACNCKPTNKFSSFLLLNALFLGAIAISPEVSATATGLSCITTNPLSLDGTHTKIIPFGCAAINTAPFMFPNVADINNVLHNLTINTFEQFAAHNGVGGVFISGMIDNTAFSGIGVEAHPPHPFNQIAQSGVTYDWILPSETIVPTVSLPTDFMMQLDTSKVSGGKLTVNGPINGLYDVSNVFSAYFEVSLNHGLSYVSIDPGFNVSTFNEATANPQIQAYINASSPIPVPAAAWLFGSGLIGLTGLTRKRKIA